MTKNQKLLLAVTAVLLFLNLAYTFFSIRPNLNTAIHTLKQTRDTIDLAIAHIHKAQTNLDTLNNSLQNLKKTSTRSELEVKIINQQMQIKLEKSKRTVDSLHLEILKNIEKLGNL